jgi:hypothetical protein
VRVKGRPTPRQRRRVRYTAGAASPNCGEIAAGKARRRRKKVAKRILGPTGGRRRRRFLLSSTLAVALAALFLTAGAQAVHEIGVFQLDANASTAVNPAPTALEDWDLICKAHPVSATEPRGCTFAPGYVQPLGTTIASPSAFDTDPSESSTDDILKGGTKDDNDIPSWKWASAKPSPPKNDITHAYAAEYTCAAADGCSAGQHGVAEGDSLLYFGADRFSNSGAANIAFWFFQDQVTQTPNGPNGTCTSGSGCPFTGTHTEGDVSLGGTTPGDILVISAFGPHAELNIFEWVGPGNATSPCFTNACTLEPLFEGGADCLAETNDPACAVTNDAVVPSPWTVAQKNAPANSFQPTNFFEGGLNLSALNVDACFSSFLINTRASDSGDAELHDVVLGQFARCVPTTTTQASTNGSVTPGTAVHDSATVTISGAGNPDDATGTIDFFLCGDTVEPFANPACSTGGTAAGADIALVDTSNPADTHDGISGANSADVNTAASPLAPGNYCFRAEADLTNYDDPDPATNTTTECFSVAKIPTTTVTDPRLAVGGTAITGPVAIGTHVVDHALVTGTTAGGNPTGNVNFFICNPSQVTGAAGSEVCADPNGSALSGNPRPLSPVTGSISQSEATSSPDVVVNQVGVWCFRAVYVPTGNTYLGSDDATHTECFTVRDSTSITTVQNWLPNDSATVNSTGGIALNGTLSFTLRAGTCLGTTVYTEPAITLSNTASGTSFNTTNGSVPATTFRVTAANNATPYFWRVVFTPSSTLVDGFTRCERTDITINDSP